MDKTNPHSADADVKILNGSQHHKKSDLHCDVLVVGAGPAGLMLACNLARFGIDVQIIDDRPDKTSTGRADGLQPKTIETFRQLGLADGLLRKGVKIYDICFWNSTTTSPLGRTNRVTHYPPSVDTLDPYVLLVHQGMIEDVFIDDLRSRGVEVTRNSPFVSVKENPLTGIVEATCSDSSTGQERNIKSLYLVGCDGAHSQVRKSLLEVKMVGESGKAAWGVLDGVIETNFPDIWSKVVVHSETAGSMLCIPRERNMTRLYIELHPGTTEPLPDEIANQEFVMRRAREILSPFRIEWKSIEWFSVYRVGQRVASRFTSSSYSIFLAGDAAHTHSPKAAQGMNVSMHDSFNLAWKLNLSLRNVALPYLAKTYELERKQVAKQLIEFDFEHANAFLAGDAQALAKNFDENIRFISGVGAEYEESLLNREQFGGKRQGILTPGALLPPAKVTRYVDANPVDFQLDIPLLSQFRIYFFVSDIEAAMSSLKPLCEFLGSEKSVLGLASRRLEKSRNWELHQEKKFKETTADEFRQLGRYTSVSRLFTPAIVTTTEKKNFEIGDLPALLKESPWTVYLDNVIHGSKSCTGKLLGGLDAGECAIVIVRPDGYVGSIGRYGIHGTNKVSLWLDDYFGGFLRK